MVSYSLEDVVSIYDGEHADFYPLTVHDSIDGVLTVGMNCRRILRHRKTGKLWAALVHVAGDNITPRRKPFVVEQRTHPASPGVTHWVEMDD